MHKLASTLTIAALMSLPAIGADLTIDVTNISEPGGTVYWKLFSTAESFAADSDPVMAATARAERSSLRFTLHNLSPGQYAVKLFHDSNNNGQLDSNLLGIPSEGYGFSNDAGKFGPPSFDEAAVSVDTDTVMTVRVR